MLIMVDSYSVQIIGGWIHLQLIRAKLLLL